MGDLLFWMGVILFCGVFGWITVSEAIRRTSDDNSPVSLLMGVRIFLVVCGVICLSIGKNTFTPENLDAGGNDVKVTVTEKEVRELESKRTESKAKAESNSRKKDKEDESVLLDDMKDFRERLMDRK